LLAAPVKTSGYQTEEHTSTGKGVQGETRVQSDVRFPLLWQIRTVWFCAARNIQAGLDNLKSHGKGIPKGFSVSSDLANPETKDRIYPERLLIGED
jgi:hypothetical protein